MGQVVIETVIAAPVERVFDLARDVGIHTETASFSDERLVSPGRLQGLLELGDLVAFEGRHFGIRQTFIAKIIEMSPPRRFVDEMVKGAFTWLKHEHEFHVHAQGTLMRDVITWKAPLGPLGRIADALFVERHMRWFVTTKQGNLKRAAETMNDER
jgi:ligand-binding SRPBCC domain-containing protein